MNIFLSLLLFILMYLVGGKRIIKSYLYLILSFLLLITLFVLISLNISPLLTSLIGSILISKIIYNTLDKKIKKEVAFKSTLITILIMTILIYLVSYKGILSGFGYEAFEEINMFSYNINIPMLKVISSTLIIGTLGAVIDASTSITSSMYEVHINNKNISKKELIKSGFNIGKNITNTEVNTIIFTFLGEVIALLILFNKGYNLTYIINNKVLAQEIIKTLIIIISSLFAIPINIYLMAKKLKDE